MNERIRELWAQCVIKHTKTPMNWQDAADEFALLIVKECIRLCDQVDLVGADDCINNIKEHFEVE